MARFIRILGSMARKSGKEKRPEKARSLGQNGPFT
jgi:hypothetical protein